MDKYFNDLASYDDTIENYINLVSDGFKNFVPVVYLVFFPSLPKYPHPLTRKSIYVLLISDKT